MVESTQRNEENSPKVQFQAKLHSILYAPVSVENIGSFADDALEKLIALNEAVVGAYERDFGESDQYTGSELEDQAYTAFRLENLNDILDQIIKVRGIVTRITTEVGQHLIESQTIITPPDSPEHTLSASGSGTYEAPKLLNRLVTLAYILERDFDLTQSDVRYLVGATTDTMMRLEPYVRVEVPSLERVVYICDEEGNASYVFDCEILDQLGIVLPELDNMTKNQRNALIRVSPTVGSRIIQSPEWRTRVATALGTPFNEDEGIEETEQKQRRSEFREKTKFLSYIKFVENVRAVYEESLSPNNVQNWYQSVYRNHTGWPSNPHLTYKEDGWISYPELVGNEKIEILSFNRFATEVKATYENEVVNIGISTWYQSVYKKHPGWPAAPNVVYKNHGWVSYYELVGIETVEFLLFEDFIVEVRDAYKVAGYPKQVQSWYREVHKSHPGWPSRPDSAYKDRGWSTLPDLVERRLKFDDFQKQIIAAYNDAGQPDNIYTWYISEYQNHLGWPLQPPRTYQDTWKSWSSLVGKEEVEYLLFEKFKISVRNAYKTAGSPGNIQSWYREIYKEHEGWPAGPHKFYKNKGWEGYPALVGKNI